MCTYALMCLYSNDTVNPQIGTKRLMTQMAIMDEKRNKPDDGKFTVPLGILPDCVEVRDGGAARCLKMMRRTHKKLFPGHIFLIRHTQIQTTETFTNNKDKTSYRRTCMWISIEI
ncbi:unnamed protein product [Heterobilharzia americana]|nr:unnamed protein product [Heterobilharzia americana]CAH8289772.1 unnamed protein product [Heterobilharzia americana]CAH8600812.1 unnamed protein product [Heterobilharzia americana]